VKRAGMAVLAAVLAAVIAGTADEAGALERTLLQKQEVVRQSVQTDGGSIVFLGNPAVFDPSYGNFEKVFGQRPLPTTLWSRARRLKCYEHVLRLDAQMATLTPVRSSALALQEYEAAVTAVGQLGPLQYVQTNHIPGGSSWADFQNALSTALRKISPKSRYGVRVTPTNLQRISRIAPVATWLLQTGTVAQAATVQQGLASDAALMRLGAIEDILRRAEASGEPIDPLWFEAIAAARDNVDRSDDYWGAFLVALKDESGDIGALGFETAVHVAIDRAHGALQRHAVQWFLHHVPGHSAVSASHAASAITAAYTWSLTAVILTIDALLDQHEHAQCAVAAATLDQYLASHAGASGADSPTVRGMTLQNQIAYYTEMESVSSGFLAGLHDFIATLVGQPTFADAREHFADRRAELEARLDQMVGPVGGAAARFEGDALYVWGMLSELLLNKGGLSPDQREWFIEQCRRTGVRTVYFSIGDTGANPNVRLDRQAWVLSSSACRQCLADLITACRSANPPIAVHAMIGASNGSLGAARQRVDMWIADCQSGTHFRAALDDVLAFNHEFGPQAAFAGLHLDIEEPSEWSKLGDYAAILQTIKTDEFRNQGMVLSVDVEPHWFTHNASAARDVIQAGGVDYVAIMAYADNRDAIWRLASTAVGVARGCGKDAVIAVETQEFWDGGTVPDRPNTFFEQGRSWMDEELRLLRESHGEIAGFAYHAYNNSVALSDIIAEVTPSQARAGGVVTFDVLLRKPDAYPRSVLLRLEVDSPPKDGKYVLVDERPISMPDGQWTTEAQVLWDVPTQLGSYDVRISALDHDFNSDGNVYHIERPTPVVLERWEGSVLIGSGSPVVGFIIDSSGSMTSNDPQDIRKQALEMIITGRLDGSEDVFIVDFDEDSVWLNPSSWRGWTRSDLLRAVRMIDSSGNTSIESGLRRMEEAMTQSGVQTPAAVLLLSDGLDNMGYQDPTDWYVGSQVPVFTVSLVGEANEALMTQIASQTGGEYLKARTAEEIVYAFNLFFNRLVGASSFIAARGTLAPGQRATHPFWVDRSAELFAVAESASGSASLRLMSPSGIHYDAVAGADPGSSGRFATLAVPGPEQGKWEATIGMVGGSAQGTPYRLQVHGESDMRIDLVPPATGMSKPGVVELDVGGDGIGLVKEMVIQAWVTPPGQDPVDVSQKISGTRISYRLPGKQPGTYRVTATVEGRRQDGLQFSRQLQRDVLVGDYVPVHMAVIEEALGSLVRAPIGTTVGNRTGITCHVFRGDPAVPENRIAQGHVLACDEKGCTVRITKQLAGDLPQAGDLLMLDEREWKGD